MFTDKRISFLAVLLLFLFSFTMMGQSVITIKNSGKRSNSIIAEAGTTEAAVLLKFYLDKSFKVPFTVLTAKDKSDNPTIILSISTTLKLTDKASFVIKSDATDIHLIANNSQSLRYAVYTLLETFGFRKFTAASTYIPPLTQIRFPKNSNKNYSPSFEYRALFYPDAFDPDFRDWHKLDWHPQDFGIWGHSFDRLVTPKDNFQKNPLLFALYEGKRRPESLCMTNDTVVEIVTQQMKAIIKQTPEAQFYSVSQNDDNIYCECSACKKLNEQYGGPQGSLYYFLNKIASRFPSTKITTLAYLHTYKPPIGIEIAPNIYTLFCPIELDRGKLLENNKAFTNTLQNWGETTPHLYLWDYTVQFSNYLSPFPNIQRFSDNYKLFKKNNVTGIFAQGYADVPGDFAELRQYVLAKLLWDSDTDIQAVTADFLRGFYGKAAPAIQQYLTLLEQNQQSANSYLDIYSGPIQSRNTFLTPEAMDQYDKLIDKAEQAVADNPELSKHIHLLRLALEFVYFEQAKFYGKDQHGMFVINANGQKQVRSGLSQRVKKFTEDCKTFGIYELNEDGISPDNYYKDWIEIANNSVTHLGENLKTSFIVAPVPEFQGKGPYGLVDGNRGFKDFNSNWIGWYGDNPEIEIQTDHLQFSRIALHFLNDQRHWIFPPEKVTIYGLSEGKWELIGQQKLEDLTENYRVTFHTVETYIVNSSKFASIKVVVENQNELPAWRKRKNKRPMVMLDEIEFY